MNQPENTEQTLKSNPSMTRGWSMTRDTYDVRCSCGWHRTLTRKEWIENPLAQETINLAANGHWATHEK